MSDIPTKSEYSVNKISCPDCGSENANVIAHILDIPYYDDYTMISVNCPECKFRASDFFNAKSKGHIKSTYPIDGKEDMRTKVVRASDGYVSIPELGVSIDPVSGAHTWIRNAEGILDDIKSKLMIALRDIDDEEIKEATIERISLVDKMINYEMPYTLIVEDKTGNSVILPADEDKLLIEVLASNTEN